MSHRFRFFLGMVTSLAAASGIVLDVEHAVGQKPRAVPFSGASGDTIVIDDAQLSLIQNTFVAAPIAGVVSKVWVAEGDSVAAGDGMVQLDDQQVQTEFEAADASFQAAKMEAENDVDARYAKRTLQVRSQELQQSVQANEGFAGAIPDTEIAKLQLVVDQAELAIEQAEHEQRVAQASASEKEAAAKIVKARWEKHKINAPVNGQVVEVAVEPGEWVEAGKPVVRLVTLDPIRVECFVDGQTYGSELVGRSIRFFLAGSEPDGGSSKSGGGKPASGNPNVLKGKVTYVSPELHPVTGQSRLWATVENPDLAARAGMRGRLEIAGR
ncbi:putative efflux pump membrane fusion protein [Rubripirellula lacrimiformis]|uniref:Putative efflux pump membrane fusion protein n=1 Tax=Rubripirellula lacrimiformis TaxID=1930273 RepID=A0A517N3Q0_9BACT|nr:HlyD family efflux transporter periplasmic adaptor subunit [Rubripirellula lacrimiformis]QDT01746.1 putative efflux pump membrane fusion protein [Rubripirellula lacrimiformis]